MALVYDPRTGMLVDDGTGVPGNPTRAAQMQAQFAQPVTGPRGVVGAQPVSGANPNAINIGGAVGDVVLGGLSTIPAAVADAARVGATQLLGGDTSSLAGGAYARTNAATDRVTGGLNALGQANSQLFGDVRSGLLGALGAAPAAPAQVPTLVPAVPAPVAATESVAQPAATQPALLDVGPINEQIATSLAALRPQAAAPATAPERGNYNMQNTDLGALRQRAAPTNGVNFGFGVNGNETARQYLDRMDQVDQQRALQGQQRMLSNEAALARQALSGNPSVGEAVAARGVLASVNPQLQAITQVQGGLAQTGMRNRGELATTTLQNQGALQRAELAGQYGLAQADLTGQYGLGAAGLRAQGTVAAQQAKLNSPESQNSLAQAQLRGLQLELARGALARGETNQAVGILSGRGTPNARIAEDFLGNPIGTYDAEGNFVPYTPEQLAQYRQSSGLAQGR